MIKNCSWNKHIAYTLEMLSSEDPMVPQNPPGVADNTPQQPSLGSSGSNAAVAAATIDSTNRHVNAHQFFWSGPTFNTGYLEPLAEVEIELVACFTQYGIYDINRWRLAVQVVKAVRKKKNVATVATNKSSNSNKAGGSNDAAKVEEDAENEEEQAMLPPVTPRGVGKGFMQMPNLAHYIQVS